MSTLARCPKKRCGCALVITDQGKVTCPWCVRKMARLCRRCPKVLRPLVGGNGPVYCPRCKKQVVNESERRRADTKAKRNAAWRARPGVQERLNEEAREWRRANPPDALDRAYQRAKYAKYKKDPAWVAATLRKQREGYHRRKRQTVAA